MPSSVPELLDLLDLECIDPNIYRGKQPDTQLQRVFGGQVAASALVAATRTVDADRHVHSLHSYFLRPGDPSVPIIYDVEALRDGRSFATRRVVARQHGHAIFYLTASFQVREEGLDHAETMPDVPAPEDCISIADVFRARSPERADHWEREWSALEVRYVGSSKPQGELEVGEHVAQQRLWIRVNGEIPDDPVQHTAVLTFASDLTLLGSALIPHGISIGSPKLQPASLDHAMWFHRPLRADEWWLYDQASPTAVGSRGLALARVFSRDGTLAATVAQEGLIRLRG